MIFSSTPNDFLAHHGIKGQKWGIRRYQNPDGTLTAEGRERYKEVFKNSFSYQNSTPSFVKVHNNLISKYKANNPNASKEDIQNLRKSLNKLDKEYVKENLDKFALADEITTFKGTTKLGISATSLAVARLAKIYSDLNGDSTESNLVEGAGYVSSVLFGAAGLGDLLVAGSNNKYLRSLKTKEE